MDYVTNYNFLSCNLESVTNYNFQVMSPAIEHRISTQAVGVWRLTALTGSLLLQKWSVDGSPRVVFVWHREPY